MVIPSIMPGALAGEAAADSLKLVTWVLHTNNIIQRYWREGDEESARWPWRRAWTAAPRHRPRHSA